MSEDFNAVNIRVGIERARRSVFLQGRLANRPYAMPCGYVLVIAIGISIVVFWHAIRKFCIPEAPL